jgi:hypothetical protein
MGGLLHELFVALAMLFKKNPGIRFSIGLICVGLLLVLSSAFVYLFVFGRLYFEYDALRDILAFLTILMTLPSFLLVVILFSHISPEELKRSDLELAPIRKEREEIRERIRAASQTFSIRSN